MKANPHTMSRVATATLDWLPIVKSYDSVPASIATAQEIVPKHPPSQPRLCPVIHSFDIQLSLTAYKKSQLNHQEINVCVTPRATRAANRPAKLQPINGNTTSWVTPMIASVSQRSDFTSLANAILRWTRIR